MSKPEFVAVFCLGLLAIFQVSFAPHLKIFSGDWFKWINFIDLAVLVIALFERRRGAVGWLAALWGGIFLDMYSDRFFGFWMIVLFAIVGAIKLILKKYVRIPSFW